MMKRTFLHLPCALAATALCASPLLGQSRAPDTLPPPITPPPAPGMEDYEPTLTLRASQILQPVFVSGPLFRVREGITTKWGMNTYAIDTAGYGTFLAWGNSQLLDRIAEISAIKRMDAVMATEAYRDAVDEAADEEEDAAEDIVPPAVDSIQEVHSTGIGKFFQRIGQDIKKDRNDEKRHDLQTFQYKSTAGVAKAKRDLCRKLGIDPYSTNPILQARLDGLSRALGLGGFTMVLGEASADPVASAVTANRGLPNPQLTPLIYGKNANELRSTNQTALQQLGISPVDATAFLSSTTFTPSQQTQLVLGLQSIAGAKGLDVFLQDATASATEQTDAIFYAETAQLLGQLQPSLGPIVLIERQNNAPFCILRDNSVLLALHWDYASWTPTASKCANWLQSLKVNGKKPPTITIAITGAASPRLRKEMEQRGIRVLDRQDRGPLN